MNNEELEQMIKENGFTVIGESACANPDNFSEITGKRLSYVKARNKVWELEGYLLRQQLYDIEQKNIPQVPQ